MEIRDKKMIEIFNTLEKIERINSAIHFHQEQATPDSFAIEQYLSIKNNLTRQLLELLAHIELKLEIAA